MDLGLKGKVALVTAASKGMGKACALGLAGEGARVAVCARNEGELKAAADEIRTKTKAEVLAVRADVTKPEDVKALVAQVRRALGDPDILIANCGGPPRGFFEEFGDDAWHGAVEVSLMSTVRLVREVLPAMRARRWGRILTIQSVSVKQPLEDLLLSIVFFNSPTDVTEKHIAPGTRIRLGGLVAPGSLSRGDALAVRFDVTDGNRSVSVIYQGLLNQRLQLTDRLLGGLKQSGLSREEYLARQGAEVPLGRVGTAEEFANVAVFLASERASYVTGVSLQIDGGLVRGLF